jgi:hypothetical protein
VTCTKTGSKNDLFLNCRRKPKELSKKELSNVAAASILSTKHLLIIVSFVNFCQQSLYFRNDFQYFALQLIVG